MPSLRGILSGLVAVLLPGCGCNAGRLGSDEAARVCIALQACLPQEWSVGYWGGSLSQCTTIPVSLGLIPHPGAIESEPIFSTGFEAPLLEAYRCIASAGGDCETVGRCLALAGPAGSCSQPNGLSSGQCTGTLLTGCTLDRTSFGVECGRYGLSCGRTGTTFFVYNACTWGLCPVAPLLKCRGTRAESCSTFRGSIVLTDCSRLGLSCRPAPDAGPPGCSSDQRCDGGASCEGSVAVTCFDRSVARLDCSRNPTMRRCEAGVCVESDRDCRISEPATCDGPRVRFCQDGTLRSYDCVALGFSGCADGGCPRR